MTKRGMKTKRKKPSNVVYEGKLITKDNITYMSVSINHLLGNLLEKIMQCVLKLMKI